MEFLDLAWVEGRSFWLGVLMAYAGPWLVLGVVVGGWHLSRRVRQAIARWRAVRSASMAAVRPLEEVRTYDAGKVALPGRRRQPQELGFYLPTAPRVPCARHSPILDRQASERLWMQITGGRDTI